MRVRVIACALACLGCDPAVLADAGPPPVGDASAPDVIAGRVAYEDRPFDADGFTEERVATPSAGVRVAILDGAREVASGRTDVGGGFRLRVPEAATALTVRVEADVEHEGHGARVVDRSREGRVHRMEATASPGQSIELFARAADPMGGALNVADLARRAFARYAPLVGDPAATLVVRWEPGRAFDCGSCYGEDTISLGGQREDTDEYDDDIVLHEIGHFFADHYGHDTSEGGAHRDRQVEPELAYGEGLAYFFAAVIRGTPLLVDTFEGSTRAIDIERYLQNGEARPGFTGTASDGALREEIVAGVLWDAFDPASPDEPFDRVALGDALLELLVSMRGGLAEDVGAEGMDLADLLRALECDAGVPAADVQALADDRAFPYAAGAGGR